VKRITQRQYSPLGQKGREGERHGSKSIAEESRSVVSERAVIFNKRKEPKIGAYDRNVLEGQSISDR